MPRTYTEPFLFNDHPTQRIGCGPLKILVAPTLGGRIVSMRFEGKELLFFKNEPAFPAWGGDKTWVAPQREWPDAKPYADLDTGVYQLTMDGVKAVMTSPVCQQLGLQIKRTVTIDDAMTLHLTEEMTNATSDKVIQKGIWNVTQLNRPCTFFIPALKKAFRSYHHEDKSLPEVQDILIENEGWTEIPCRSQTLFKCGGIPKEGQVLAKMPLGGPREVVWLRTFDMDGNAPYAHGAVVEVFNSDTSNYAEIEVHAPLATLNPGESCSLQQQWRFMKI